MPERQPRADRLSSPLFKPESFQTDPLEAEGIEADRPVTSPCPTTIRHRIARSAPDRGGVPNRCARRGDGDDGAAAPNREVGRPRWAAGGGSPARRSPGSPAAARSPKDRHRENRRTRSHGHAGHARPPPREKRPAPAHRRRPAPPYGPPNEKPQPRPKDACGGGTWGSARSCRLSFAGPAAPVDRSPAPPHWDEQAALPDYSRPDDSRTSRRPDGSVGLNGSSGPEPSCAPACSGSCRPAPVRAAASGHRRP